MKQGEKDTFSKFIERTVPKKGTFEAVMEVTKALLDWDKGEYGSCYEMD